jgi:hypothetical protein
MTHYLAHISSLSEDMIGFQCVPTDKNYQDVEYERPGIRGWLTDEGWKVKCFEDLLTGDISFPPECFELSHTFVDRLNEGRERIRGQEGKIDGGWTSVRINTAQDRPTRATGTAAKQLKEDEAEEAIKRAYEGAPNA